MRQQVNMRSYNIASDGISKTTIMPLYKYTALTKQGKKITGSLDAPGMQEVKELLKAQGLFVVEVELAELLVEKKPFLWGIFERGVDPKTIIRFTKQLHVLLAAGVPLLQALELLVDQFNGKMHRIIVDVKDRLKGGESFASSLSNYPGVFSSVYVQLVRAGEATGKLEHVLERLVIYIEGVEEVKKRLRKATIYPAVLLTFSFAIVAGLVLGLVPLFSDMFKQLNVEPPAITVVLLIFSNWFKSYYLYMLTVIALAILFLFYWKRTVAGKHAIDKLLLRLPLTAYLSKTKVVVQFSKTLGLLLDSGVNLAEALDIVCNIIDNTVLIDALKAAREKIIKEGKIAYYLKETGIFPPIASYMISTGEQSGELAKMLLVVGRDYDVELSEIIDGLIARINPIMLLVIAGIVILLVATLFVPMFDAIEKIQATLAF